MSLSNIVTSIDREIAVLRKARELLAKDVVEKAPAARARGAHASAPSARPARTKKRRLSPEGRRRIAEAVKRRWEAHRKAAAKKEAVSK